jgi:uncharacterized RDD family membrane protein YckC
MAAEQLTEHHAAGRLTLDELRERTDAVYDARTMGQLRAVLADLPASSGALASPWESLLAGRPRPPLPGYAYGGFWARAGGLWVDVIIIGALIAGVDPAAAAAHVSALPALIPPAYFTGFWGAVARTPGMWLVGVRVVRAEDGGRLGFRRSFIRACGYLLDLASCLVGFGWAAVDPRRQAWHDKFASSLVVKRLR